MLGRRNNDSTFSLLSKIKSRGEEIDRRLDEVQNENLEIKKQQEEEIENLSNKKAEMENRIRENDFGAQIESELNALKLRKNDAIAKKQSYKRQIEDYEIRIAQEKAKTKEIDFGATLAMYKAIAPVKILSSSGNSARGFVAFGTPETTKFFDYNTHVSNEFWDDLVHLYELSKKI